MPARFHPLSLPDFATLLGRFPFRRKINSVHMHHTWRPNHSQYKGLASIEGMWRYHTEEKGWDDIAQHLTIAPDGTIWTGRNWNSQPISAKGHNGNATAGPFMFEIIGDFDHGRDRFEGKQREVTLKVIALVQKRFDLPPEKFNFHNHMSPKSCPGSAIDYQQILEEVRQLHATPHETLVGAVSRNLEEGPFGEDALQISQVLRSLSQASPSGKEPPDDELPEQEMQDSELYRLFSAEAPAEHTERHGSRASRLTPDMLGELRPHIINLKQGQFSADGRFTTAPGDVEAMFGEHLPRELKSAKARDEKLRLVFYAHGGLVSESNALESAYRHVLWWKRNNVYPIYFVWETGFFETIGQLLARSRQRVLHSAARDLWDHTTDPIIEAAARAMYGPTIWSGMKWSAARSVAPDGGARYVAKRLQEFCSEQGDSVELHAVGHSAGSIFQAHFLTEALNVGVPQFRSTHFLAPAIRTDLFKETLAGRLGNGIDQLTIFTMRKDLERADHCLHVYRKSLLYLIYYALEPERKTPILGLETSLREDLDLSRQFGLAGASSQVGEVVWSVSPTTAGRSASTSRSHGGFDDDPATMNSLLRRVLGKGDNDKIVDFTASQRERELWTEQIDWPEELIFLSGSGVSWSPSVQHPVMTAPSATPSFSQPGKGGRRRALCIGIDRYATAPLAGCVADARLWAETLLQLGFEPPTLLLDEAATRAAILDALSNLITSSTAGDVVVFQFAGHGTQLPDISGDEAGEDSPEHDEAICPYDLATGAFVIDDDVADIFARIPDGVNVTCFIDCCHSGTISRFGVGPSGQVSGAPEERPRYIKADGAMIAAHRRLRERLGRRRSLAPRGPESMREVLFSACLSSEVAWESGGQGEFSLRATRLLKAGAGGMTHEDFLQAVVTAFGPAPRQHPDLDCAPTARARKLLEPLTAAALETRSRSNLPAAEGSNAAAQLLRLLASALER